MTHRPYLIEPGNESCYEYLLGCYGRISADVGDYAAFVNLDCTTMMSKMFEDVEYNRQKHGFYDVKTVENQGYLC